MNIRDQKTALLSVIEKSSLEKSKSDYILSKFENYFELASEWDRMASEIVVTNDDDLDMMRMARELRLSLKEKRNDVEKVRVTLKADALREGQTIDAIANVFKGIIQPIEEYLSEQENFTKLRIEREVKERIRIENDDRRMQAEHDAMLLEQTRIAEQEKIKTENKVLNEALVAERAKSEAERLEKERLLQSEKVREQAQLLAESILIAREATLKQAPDKEKIKIYFNELQKFPLPQIEDQKTYDLIINFREKMQADIRKILTSLM